MSDETTPLNGSQSYLDHDREAGQDGKTGSPTPHIDRGFLAIAFLGIYLGAADESFVLATHGEIASRFQQVALGPWLISAYTLGYMTTLPLYGRLSDLYGARCILLIAYLSFAVGCGITGLAPSIWVAICGRLVAGFGAAGMTDLVSVIVNDLAPPREVAVIRSYFGIFIPLGISTGGPFGGILTDLVGWRLSFLLQVPLGLACYFTTYWRLATQAEEDSKQTPEGYADPVKPDVNAPGIILLGLLLTSLMVLCHSLGGYGQAKNLRLVISIGCVILFGLAFWWNEKYRTKSPLMPLKEMLANQIWVIYLAQFLVYFSLFGIISNMSEYFIRTRNASNKSSGAFFVMLTIGSVLGSVISGYSIKKTGKYKTLSVVGLLLMITAVVLFMIIQNVLQDNRFAFKYLPPNLQEIIANTFMKVSFVPPSMCLVVLLFAIPTICFLPQRSLD
ncbi:Major facilitator superfamily domain general substrate transporter [Penicillium citrinum]|uniref:Major facilitator superfamily domain general substrate transporter n=1 Tax=Penicillium citrinum TaxID=5077 RepID=A0A9W9NRL8_PENCI|nr:Major facilitator superfamily domain general substrate transporter [Penicillium citrinum]KAJ5224804.1 Major facilitator superfamily domain general substrate transporter [Penicillium citrinum]